MVKREVVTEVMIYRFWWWRMVIARDVSNVGVAMIDDDSFEDER